MPWFDSDLYRAPCDEVLKDGVVVGHRANLGHQVLDRKAAATEMFSSFGDGFGCEMKDAEDGQPTFPDPFHGERDFGAAFAAAEQKRGAVFGRGEDRIDPDVGLAGALDHHIDPLSVGPSAQRLPQVWLFVGIDHLIGADLVGKFKSGFFAPEHQEAGRPLVDYQHLVQKADGARPDDGDRLASQVGKLLLAINRAGQRLHQRGFKEVDVLGFGIEIALDDMGRDADFLGEGS